MRGRGAAVCLLVTIALFGCTGEEYGYGADFTLWKTTEGGGDGKPVH